MPFCQSYFAAFSARFHHSSLIPPSFLPHSFLSHPSAFSVPSPLGEVGWGLLFSLEEVGWGLLFSVGLGLQFAQE